MSTRRHNRGGGHGKPKPKRTIPKANSMNNGVRRSDRILKRLTMRAKQERLRAEVQAMKKMALETAERESTNKKAAARAAASEAAVAEAELSMLLSGMALESPAAAQAYNRAEELNRLLSGMALNNQEEEDED